MLTFIINMNSSVRKFAKIIHARDADSLENGSQLIVEVFLIL